MEWQEQALNSSQAIIRNTFTSACLDQIRKAEEFVRELNK